MVSCSLATHRVAVVWKLRSIQVPGAVGQDERLLIGREPVQGSFRTPVMCAIVRVVTRVEFPSDEAAM